MQKSQTRRRKKKQQLSKQPAKTPGPHGERQKKTRLHTFFQQYLGVPHPPVAAAEGKAAQRGLAQGRGGEAAQGPHAHRLAAPHFPASQTHSSCGQSRGSRSFLSLRLSQPWGGARWSSEAFGNVALSPAGPGRSWCGMVGKAKRRQGGAEPHCPKAEP